MFVLANVCLLLMGLLYYFLLRCAVSSCCHVSGRSRSFFKKHTKGAANFWLYRNLSRQCNLGILYPLNTIYLLTLGGYGVLTLLCWVPFLKIPVALLGILLGMEMIVAGTVSLIYGNLEDFGRRFVFFRIRRGVNGKSRRFATLLDWLFGFFPLAMYLLLITKNIWW